MPGSSSHILEWLDSIENIERLNTEMAEILRPMRFLSQFLSWWQQSGRDIAEVQFINQDEFTIDVIVPVTPQQWLVLDCT